MGGCAPSSDFRVQNFAKTDIDVVTDIHRDYAVSLLKSLTRKLYKMNPSELKKTVGATIDSRIDLIFQCPQPENPPPQLQQKNGADALLLGFDSFYTHDRVFATMYGLYSMILKSYGNRCENYLTDFLEPQDLYNSARNIEIFVWRLKHRRAPDGRLFLATNQFDGPIHNLSFERLFGKLISTQDTMAKIVSTQTGRIITRAVHAVATMTFLPVGVGM